MTVTNGVFNSDTPPQFIAATFSNLKLTGNTFEQKNGFDQTSASQIRDGSAVKIDTTVIFSATSNTFKNLISGNGALSLTDSTSSTDLSDLYPSLVGGSTKLVTLSSNTFTG